MDQKWTLFATLVLKERADKYLHALLEEEEDIPSLSRSQIQKLIEQGLVLVSGKTIRTKDFIPLNAEIELILPPPTLISVEPENIPIPFLYEDEHLVVVNKPPGLTVHPSETQKSGTLVNALLYHIKDLSGIGGKLRPGIVHRIDKDTSGALVVTKTDEAHQGLSKLFAKHDLERVYWAICYGAPAWEGTYTMQTSIGRSPLDRKKMAVNVANGRQAISHFTSLEAYGVSGKSPFSAWIEAKLETGRTHQIRVHLNHLGHSILGDPTYGTPSAHQPKWKNLPNDIQVCTENLSGQALHARTLGFVHPVTGKKLHFEAEPFPAFSNLLQVLKSYR